MAVEFISWALKQKIPTGPKFVLVALANRSNEDGECWPSYRDIAAQTSISERSISDHIQLLVDKGFLEVWERRGKDGYKTSNGYRIVMISDAEISPEKFSGESVSAENPADSHLQISQDYKPYGLSNRQREPSETRAREFSDWYGLYPHKVGRAAAAKAFDAARRKADLTTLQEGLRRYIASKPPDRSWCNPATWLNQERWLDQPSEIEGNPNETNIRKPTNAERMERAGDAAVEALLADFDARTGGTAVLPIEGPDNAELRNLQPLREAT